MGLPSFTRRYYHAPYPAINPARPELSASGKVVVISGGGTGIGAATGHVFAQAGAKAVVLLGRRLEPLNETKLHIEANYSSTSIITCSLDICDESAVSSLFQAIAGSEGPIDVCINGAGYLSDKGTIKDGLVSDFWAAFEINVKGAYIMAQHFLRHAAPNSVLIGLNSLIAHMPAGDMEMTPSSYACSKIAQAKLYEYVAAENPNTRSYSIQPGVVETDMALKSVSMAPPGKDNPFLPWDDVSLPACFCLWLSSSEGVAVPSGKFLWSNWDVEELKERSAELHKDGLALTLTLPGWPFPVVPAM